MTVRFYRSTDASAPTLSGTAGSLIALLDACLVNGYGSQAAAGWTKPFSGTNLAVYRNSTTLGTGFYLDVNDAAPVTACEARMRGYEVMTATGTGTNPFPTTAQMSSGIIVRKATSANTTARPWYLLADETVFYLFIENGDYTLPTRTSSFAFGDFYSYKANDAYRCMIIGRDAENTNNSSQEHFPQTLFGTQTLANTTHTAHYVARGFNGIGGSAAFGKHTDGYKSGQSAGAGSYCCLGWSNGAGAMSYPNPADSGLYMGPVYLHHNGGLRGYLKGLWAPLHDLPLGHTDTVNGTGAASSKSFLAMVMQNYSSAFSAQCLLETSNTWS